ncbi:MAG: VCBS repeat-containing protein [Bacteroidetes bacterium]|nr:VCBS repeat-containing protein [Bacteroidota bacterium]MCL2301864.1 VCBS repeat-containing protein [Lentimicrobiaceae bacterium]
MIKIKICVSVFLLLCFIFETTNAQPTGNTEQATVTYNLTATQNIAEHDILQIITCYPSAILDVFANDVVIPCTRIEIELTITSGSKIGATTSVDSDKNIVYTYPAGFTGRDTLEYAIVCKNVVYTANVFITVVECPDNIDEVDCYGDPQQTTWGVRLIPHSLPTNYSTTHNVLVGDVYNDGKPAIVALRGANGNNSPTTISIIDGQTLTERTSFSAANSFSGDIPLAAIGRIKYSATVDTTLIFFKTGTTLYAYNAYGNTVYTASGFINNGTSFQLIDLDGDGYSEIVIGNRVYAAENGALLCSAGTNQGIIRGWDARADLVQTSAGDLLGNGKKQVAVGNTIYDVTINNRNAGGGTMTIARTFTPQLWNGTIISSTDGATQLVDMDLDGHLDVVVSVNVGTTCYFYVYSPFKNQIIASIQMPQAVAKRSMPFISNIAGNESPEIIFIHGATAGEGTTGLFITALQYNPNSITGQLEILWQIPHDDASGCTGITAFDFNQDGLSELVYRDEKNLRIINGSGKSHITGNDTIPFYNLFIYASTSTTGREYPVIADIDGDGEAEIIIAGGDVGRPTMGPLQIFKSNSSLWAPARKVWNQYAYQAVGVNEDLTIPRYQMNPATQFPNGKQPFNNFLQQQTQLNTIGNLYWPLANIVFAETPEATSTCDSIVFTGCITNVGDAALQQPIYVTFYKNDTIATHIIAMDSIQNILRVDSTLCFELTINNISDHAPFTSIWISINDRNGNYPYQAQCEVDGRREIAVKACDLTAEFYANDVHHLVLQDTTFCASYVGFRAETGMLHEEPGRLMWYIEGTEEFSARDQTEWGRNFPNGNYQVKMWVRFKNGETETIISTLKVHAGWIKIRNIRQE